MKKIATRPDKSSRDHLGPIFRPCLCLACLIRNFIISNLEADSAISWPRNRDPQPPEKTISWKDILQLGKGGVDDPSGGLRPPRPHRSFFWGGVFCVKLALFSSPPRKLSLPPSDRARRCDSESPNESSVAQI